MSLLRQKRTVQSEQGFLIWLQISELPGLTTNSRVNSKYWGSSLVHFIVTAPSFLPTRELVVLMGSEAMAE